MLTVNVLVFISTITKVFPLFVLTRSMHVEELRSPGVGRESRPGQHRSVRQFRRRERGPEPRRAHVQVPEHRHPPGRQVERAGGGVPLGGEGGAPGVLHHPRGHPGVEAGEGTDLPV